MTLSDQKRYGWVLNLGRVEYERALCWQRGLVKMRQEGLARDTIIFVEHPSVVTVGRNGHEENLGETDRNAVHVERGGDVTYHGPGQLVVYFIFNLAARRRDLHRFVSNLQLGVVDTFKDIGIAARRGDEHTGIWVDEKKIASVGVAVKKWITFHGVAINLNMRLEDFRGIRPCGLDAEVMTSAHEILGRGIDVDDFAGRLLKRYAEVFDTVFEPVRLEELAEEIESQAGGYTI